MNQCPLCEADSCSEREELTAFESDGRQLSYRQKFDFCGACEAKFVSAEQATLNRRAMVRAEIAAFDLPDPAKLVAWRKHWGLSQQQAGRLLKVGPTAFSKYENYVLTPSGPTCQLLKLLLSDDNSTVELARLSHVTLTCSESQLMMHTLIDREYVASYLAGGTPAVVLVRTSNSPISSTTQNSSYGSEAAAV